MDLAMQELLRKLETRKCRLGAGVVGFDGFVDEIVHVVDKRYDAQRFKRIQTIGDYAARIAKAAGVSTNIEVVSMQRKIGGNGPIFANALLKHGVPLAYIGALGYPAIAPVFEEFAAQCKVYSVSEPGLTDAVEFLDGKIIRSKLDSLKDVCWEQICRVVGLQQLIALYDSAEFWAFLNWSLLMHASDIWQGFLRDVVPGIRPKPERKLFVDLADPEKRSQADIRAALDLLGKLNGHVHVILGLNKKEACEIAELFGRTYSNYSTADPEDLMGFLLYNLEIGTLVLHTTKSAYVCGGNTGFYGVESPFCETPKISTGAGDNFNAGYMLGQSLGLTPEESLHVAVCNAGYYVRHGQSPDTGALVQFMKECL